VAEVAKEERHDLPWETKVKEEHKDHKERKEEKREKERQKEEKHEKKLKRSYNIYNNSILLSIKNWLNFFFFFNIDHLRILQYQ
jgi:hypothetical protein